VLRHTHDRQPGITRRKIKSSWAYFAADGSRITDREEIDRLNAIALPPAYIEAWFCPHANGHVQATGRDAKGRKQYRYHAEFRAKKDASKYDNTLDFGAALPRLRKAVAAHLKGRTLSRDTVLAAVVRLLDTQYLRVGNEQYAKANKSFGATTLRNRHLKAIGNLVTMRFVGKHGVVHEVPITDSNLKRIVRKTRDLPGQNLFEYVNADGDCCAVNSSDVNAYIREGSGGDFTAKNFRTWGASVIAFEQMLAAQTDEDVRKVSIKTVLEPVAEALGNTPAISRKSYVHPQLIAAARDNPKEPLGTIVVPKARKWMSAGEVALLAYLLGSKRRKSAPAKVEKAIAAAKRGPAAVEAVASAA
jgi:DNA topoisomerase I